MSFANWNNFFSISMPLIYFSCLVAMARTSSIVLNKNGESGHPCLLPNIREKLFCLLQLSMMLAVCFFVDVLY